jgi:hypothetical protein
MIIAALFSDTPGSQNGHTWLSRMKIFTYHLPDDRQVMRDLILKTNQSYTIVQEHHKLYAW